MSALDPTSRVCLSCQQNHLQPSFIDEASDQRSMFKVRLDIRTQSGNSHRRLFSFVGYATSKKAAKKEAALKALNDSNFTKTVNPSQIRPGYRKDPGHSKGRTPPTSSSAGKRNKPQNRTFYGAPDENLVSGNPFPTAPAFQPAPVNRPPAAEHMSSNQASNANTPAPIISRPVPSSDPRTQAGRNHIVNLYFKAKKSNLKTTIKFACLHQNETVVKITVGFESKAAQGRDDLEAIERAAVQFDLNAYNRREGNPHFEKDCVDYYYMLNQLHLKTRKEFKSSCLLSIEEEGRSLFLCKCQLGEFISYGLEESIACSQSAAAKEILVKLRKDLNDEIDELTKTLEEIESKRKEKLDLINSMDVEMDRLASDLQCEYECEYDKELDDLNDTKMIHDL